MRTPGLLVTSLLCALLLACGDAEQRADDARERAEAAIARGDREQALRAIDALERIQDDSGGADAEALAGRARLLVAAGEAARAVWLLEDGVERFPGSGVLRLALAEAALRVNDPSRAERALAPIAPDADLAPQALLLRARAAIALGDLDAGLAHFREAEALDPDDPALRGARIGALLAERRFEEAARAVRDAAEVAEGVEQQSLAGAFALALHQLRAADAGARWQQALRVGDAAGAETARADLAGAVDDLGALARDAPAEVAAAAWPAWVDGLVAGGRAPEAVAALDAARAEQPDRAALHVLAARARLAQGDEAGAEAALRDAAGAREAGAESAAAVLPLVRFLSVRGRHDEAQDVLDAALAAAPEDPLLLHARAQGRLDAGAADAADAAIDAFADVRPARDPAVALLRARSMLLRGDAERAAVRLRALAPRLDTAPTQYWLARALEASGDGAGAERRYALASQRAPDEPGPLLALARLARERGAWREAAVAGQQLVLRTPNAVDGWETWQEALLALNEADAAAEVAERAAALLPEDPAAPLLRARGLRAQGRHEEALRVLDAARERFGERAALVSETMLALAASGRGSDALAQGARALEAADPDERAALHHARALVFFGADRWDEGARAVDAALAAEGADTASGLRALRTRCRFAAARGRPEAALRDCARYLASRPADADIHFVLGAVHDARGDAAAAARSYERAAALDPRAAAPRNNLALLRHDAGDLDGALDAAQQAYALAPDDAQVLDTLGGLYLAKGLRDRAIALLERAHALAPDDAAISQRLEDARLAAPAP